MKRFIQTLKNIWSIEDLRKRILYTLGLVLIYRIGSYVVLPGVDPSQLQGLQKQGSEGLMGLLNMFSGGAFSNASIFALGIMPYITNMMYQLGASSTAIYPFDGSAPSPFFWVSSIIILISGTLFVMWLGERITDKGVGNGISLLIMIGIIARLPFALFGEFASRCGHPACHLAGSGYASYPCAVRQAHCWQQAVWWCSSVYSHKG